MQLWKGRLDWSTKRSRPLDDIRSTAWYRMETAPVLVRRAILAAAGMADQA